MGRPAAGRALVGFNPGWEAARYEAGRESTAAAASFSVERGGEREVLPCEMDRSNQVHAVGFGAGALTSGVHCQFLYQNMLNRPISA